MSFDCNNETQSRPSLNTPCEDSSPSAVVETLHSLINACSGPPANENSFGEIETSIADRQELRNEQEFHIPLLPYSPKEAQVIKVHHSPICKDMVSYFQDEGSLKSSIVFEIIDDCGKPKKRCWGWCGL